MDWNRNKCLNNISQWFCKGFEAVKISSTSKNTNCPISLCLCLFLWRLCRCLTLKYGGIALSSRDGSMTQSRLWCCPLLMRHTPRPPAGNGYYQLPFSENKYLQFLNQFLVFDVRTPLRKYTSQYTNLSLK